MAEHVPTALSHVQDQNDSWHIFDFLFGGVGVRLPSFELFGHRFQVTKFMILELIAAVLVIAIFVPLARRARSGALPRGPWWNAFETLLTFIRDEVARPNLGEHDADRFVPFLWTQFLFVLFCNLLGMIPFMGSPTASIWVTGGLAACSFVMMHGPGLIHEGPIRYFQSLWPSIEIPYIGWFFGLLIFVIEMIGSIIKAGVLAVRLFANMFAGHMVLATILLFIYTAGVHGITLLWVGVSVASVVGVVLLSLLELFVAFLQAYIFTFLTALFMGMNLHPAH